MPSETVNPVSEPATRYPPVGRTFKRFLKTWAILLFLIAAMWITWDLVAHHSLAKRIAALRANGEPVYIEDFRTPPILDSENALVVYDAAAKSLNPNIDSPSESSFSFVNYPPYPAAWWSLEKKAIVADQQALALAHQARGLDQTGNQVPSKSPAYWLRNNMPFAQSRKLANRIADAAQYAHLTGDDELAIQRLLDLERFGRAVGKNGNLLANLVGLGIRYLLDARIVIIALDLQVAGSPNAGKHAASRKNVVELIGKLLQYSDPVAEMRRTFQIRRMIYLDASLWLHNHATILRPFYDDDAILITEYYNEAIKTASQPNWPAARAMPQTSSQMIPIAGGIFSPGFSFDRTVEAQWRAAASHCVSAIALAIRLYQIDHNAWPKDLRQLVPNYMPYIPIDPLQAGNVPIGYVIFPAASTGAVRPMLYCSGPATSPPAQRCPGLDFRGSTVWDDLTAWEPPVVKDESSN